MDYLIELIALVVGGIVGYFNDKIDYIRDNPMYVLIGAIALVGIAEYMLGGCLAIPLAIGLIIGFIIYRQRGGW